MPRMTSGTSGGIQLKRTLGLAAITAFGVGDILGAGVYGLVGRIAGMVGSAAWTAYAVAGVMAALTGLTYAEWASRQPRAGGAAHFCEVAFRRPWITFLVIFCVTLSGLFSMATASRIFASYALSGLDGVPDWVRLTGVPLLFVLALGAVAARGIRISSGANVICTAVELLGLLIVLVVGARFIGGGHYLEFAIPPDSATPRMDAALVAVSGASLAFFAFIGFEDLVNLSEETRDAERVIPLGICLAIVITTAIYGGIAIVAVAVLPPATLAASSAPLLDVVRAAAPRFPASLYAVIPGFAVFNTALLNLLMASRLLYGMSRSRARLLPAAFGRLHPRWNTPVVGVAVSAAIVAGLLMAFADIKTLAAGTSSFLLLVFVLLHAGLLIVKRDPAAPRPRFQVPALVPSLGMLTGVVLLARQDPAALTAAARLVAVALVFFLVRRLVRGPVQVEALD